MITQNNYLEHHGIKGQKWGIRRYQNPDGTLTEAGRKRFYTQDSFGRDVLNKRGKKFNEDRKKSITDIGMHLNGM